MTNSNDVEVIIGGEVLTLSGAESEEYLQKVASYINNKLIEVTRTESFRRQTQERQSVLLALNIADDYYKALARIKELEETISTKDNELYNIKSKLVNLQIKLENTEKNVKTLENQANEYSKKIIRLETELKN